MHGVTYYDEDDVRDYVGRGWGDPGPEHPGHDNGDNERNRRREQEANERSNDEQRANR